MPVIFIELAVLGLSIVSSYFQLVPLLDELIYVVAEVLAPAFEISVNFENIYLVELGSLDFNQLAVYSIILVLKLLKTTFKSLFPLLYSPNLLVFQVDSFVNTLGVALQLLNSDLVVANVGLLFLELLVEAVDGLIHLLDQFLQLFDLVESSLLLLVDPGDIILCTD